MCGLPLSHSFQRTCAQSATVLLDHPNCSALLDFARRSPILRLAKKQRLLQVGDRHHGVDFDNCAKGVNDEWEAIANYTSYPASPRRRSEDRLSSRWGDGRGFAA
jgi:hypothetical protein